MTFLRKSLVAIAVWQILYFAWFVATGDIHALISGIAGQY